MFLDQKLPAPSIFFENLSTSLTINWICLKFVQKVFGHWQCPLPTPHATLSFAPFYLILSPSSVSVSLNSHYIYPDSHLYLKNCFCLNPKKMSTFLTSQRASPPLHCPRLCFYHNQILTTICFLSPYFSFKIQNFVVSPPHKKYFIPKTPLTLLPMPSFITIAAVKICWSKFINNFIYQRVAISFGFDSAAYVPACFYRTQVSLGSDLWVLM